MKNGTGRYSNNNKQVTKKRKKMKKSQRKKLAKQQEKKNERDAELELMKSFDDPLPQLSQILNDAAQIELNEGQDEFDSQQFMDDMAEMDRENNIAEAAQEATEANQINDMEDDAEEGIKKEDFTSKEHWDNFVNSINFKQWKHLIDARITNETRNELSTEQMSIYNGIIGTCREEPYIEDDFNQFKQRVRRFQTDYVNNERLELETFRSKVLELINDNMDDLNQELMGVDGPNMGAPTMESIRKPPDIKNNNNTNNHS